MVPDHVDLPLARARLAEHQDEVKQRLHRLAKNRDVRGMATNLDCARHMGIPADELFWAEDHLRALELETPSPRPSGAGGARANGSGAAPTVPSAAVFL